VRVTTATVEKAGTDASIFIILGGVVDGTGVDSGERKLTKSLTNMNKFESGNTDIFVVRSVNLGSLTKLKVWNDNTGYKMSGTSWLCESVEVVWNDTSIYPHMERSVLFPCGQWLSKTNGLVRELLPSTALVPTTRYYILVSGARFLTEIYNRGCH
jgi:hypothetical protein